MAYVVAETTNLDNWKQYAQNVLGMATTPSPDGGLYVRMDERQFRFVVQSGARDAYVATGWEVPAQADFEHALQVLSDAGVAVVLSDTARCRLRCAQQVAEFADPSGNRHELVWGFKSDFAHFASPTGVSRFVTGAIGMGQRLQSAEGVMQKIQDSQQELTLQDPERRLYSRAAKMVELGADLDEVMSECELPQAEAELLISLRKGRT
jgi:3,4-dihydroxy-9,10-secoandrosta-1,3,5(10)-triene-9,17-dione 4,5-dioxygenase